MKRRIYRNLDRPFTLFGIKGRFIPVALIALLGIVTIAVVVGTLLGTFVGLATAVVFIVGGYLALTEIQQRFGEKQLQRLMAGKRLPRFVKVRSNTWRR